MTPPAKGARRGDRDSHRHRHRDDDRQHRADVPRRHLELGVGGHFATSDGPFDLIQIGCTQATSYAYPGGLRLKVINPQ